jgi:hypothetical protein
LSQNQLASVLECPPMPLGSLGEGDLEQSLGLFRLVGQAPSYSGPHAAIVCGAVYLPGCVAGMVVA